VPALLLRLDPNPFHHGTLGAVRSLGRAGVEVHAVLESPRSPVAHSRYLHGFHRQPADGTSQEQVTAVLHRAAERIGRPAVLIPMDDLSALAAARLPEPLARHFLVSRRPLLPLESLADKALLAEVCRTHDIPHPPTLVPDDADEAAAAVSHLGLPLVAKWSRPWLLPRGDGLRSTTLLHDRDAVRRLYDATPRAGSRLLLQALVPGGRGTDWFFHGCFGADGRCLLGGAGRKELSWPVGAGLTAVGRWLPHPAVEQAALRLAAAVGYRGILDLDFRRDPETGSCHLLDFNPRPGAQFRLFTDGAGTDVVRALHLELTGRPVPPARPVPGRVFLAENYALLSALASPASARGRLRPLFSRAETAWFAADDPAPFRAMAAACGGRAARKGARLVSSSAGPGRSRACPPAATGHGRSAARYGRPGSAGC
jgi:predicted ATP-grasp superfamily ATP-dependent carboligase